MAHSGTNQNWPDEQWDHISSYIVERAPTKAVIGSGRVSSGHECLPLTLTWLELSWVSTQVLGSTRVWVYLMIGIIRHAQKRRETKDTKSNFRVNPRGNLTWLEDFSTSVRQVTWLEITALVPAKLVHSQHAGEEWWTKYEIINFKDEV